MTDVALRLKAARDATEAAGAALMAVRDRGVVGRAADGGQVKACVDRAAEGWVVGWLQGLFPGDAFLCEEAFEEGGRRWTAPDAYWTVDALDGTRSFLEGYDGFCVQVAYVAGGRVRVGVVHEPARARTYWGVDGGGAFLAGPGGETRLRVAEPGARPPVFVDSTPPGGAVGALRAAGGGSFLECGSIGLKICRVADGSADVYAKPIPFKLWDCAPGEVIVREAGGRLGTWDGAGVRYDADRVYLSDILAAPAESFARLAADLRST